MWYIYIDESGDLGFDFVNKKPSRFFTVCILATSQRESFLKIQQAVRKTIRRKLNKAKGNRIQELKGTNTTISIKRYFWQHIEDATFGLYSITLNKRRVYERLTYEKDRVYNFIARKVLDQIPFEKASTRVQIVVDKSKSQPAIVEFNKYIFQQLEGRLDPKAAMSIDHLISHKDAVLQATDLFTWGIFRKYEKRDDAWYREFEKKVIFDELYL